MTKRLPIAAAKRIADAVHLGSLRTSLARIPACKSAFMALMQAAFAEAVKDTTGVQLSWTRPQLAPEHERSGNA